MRTGILSTIVILAALLAGPSVARSNHRGNAPGPQDASFDYYVLSLSWSPAYCESHRTDTVQCGATRYGFVLHGLWPEGASGRNPDTCRSAFTLDDSARSLGRSIFPSEKLVAHEWDKHGTCSGLDASAYFQQADSARNLIHIPDVLKPGSSKRTMSASELSSLLRDANPGLPSKSLAITCAQGKLSEVRVCLDKNLAPIACQTGVRNSCGAGAIEILGVN